MNRLFLLLLIGANCFAGSPESLVGYVYTESGVLFNRDSYQLAVVLNTDGTYWGLYRKSGTEPTAELISPDDGVWSYRKIDAGSGELTFRSSVTPRETPITLGLLFDTDTGGLIFPSNRGSAASSFRIEPIVAGSGISNTSNMSFVRAGGSASAGFVITGKSMRTVLVRAVGPSLAQFGVSDTLKDPKLVLLSGSKTMGSNDDWDGAGAESMRRTSTLVGAFALLAGSKDAAIIVALAPGNYVASVSSSSTSDAGQVLIEAYLLP